MQCPFLLTQYLLLKSCVIIWNHFSFTSCIFLSFVLFCFLPFSSWLSSLFFLLTLFPVCSSYFTHTHTQRNIKVGKKCILFKREKGIYCIGHVIDEEGRFYKYNKLTKKYNIQVNYLEYFGCVQAIKTYLKRLLLNQMKWL